MSRPEPKFWLDSSRGVYIPRDFAESFTDRVNSVTGVSAEDWKVLEAGPEQPDDDYWEVWVSVLDTAIVRFNGVTYHPYQMNDLWLIPEGMEWSDDEEFFVWPEQEATEN